VPLIGDDPEPVPILRVRGTGHTEMELYRSLKKLRQAILDSPTAKLVGLLRPGLLD
jgi:hypothetical protein